MRLFYPSTHQKKLIIEDVIVMKQRAKFGAIGCDYMTYELLRNRQANWEAQNVSKWRESL